jgi:hypothetical protein
MTMITAISITLLLLSSFLSCTYSFSINGDKNFVSRRDIIIKTAPAIATLLTIRPDLANAGIDPNALKSFSVEGDESGAMTRLRQLQKEEESVVTDVAFIDLPSGVSYGEYKTGKGDATVQQGSKVGAEMTIRCKSFATAAEPGGLKYYSTKEDTDFNEVAWTIGSGEILPGLEEGMMGMKKGAIRRIEIPSTQVFAARKANQLLLPSDKNKDGKRRFENLFKTDATIIVEVLITRIK